jgi:hypothetical protein
MCDALKGAGAGHSIDFVRAHLSVADVLNVISTL